MPNWQNWSGRLTNKPTSIQFPRSAEDAAAMAKSISDSGEKIRVAGATHSHAPLVSTDATLIDAQGLAGVRSVDRDAQVAWIAGGSRIFTLGHALHQHGLALHNQGDIDQQAIAGATATGTHGTGTGLKNLSAAVVGVELATAGGELLRATPEQNHDIWLASRLHLGAFGIVTQVALDLRPSYVLAERSWDASLEDALAELPNLASDHRHCEFFWYPQDDRAQIKVISETDAEPIYPLAEEGNRQAWSFEVLPNHRPHKHTEMEYSVPVASAIDCMRDLRSLLANEFTDVAWPVEFRYLAADDVWLSTAYQRDTVTLSVHQDVRLDETPYYHACEEIFLSYQGRPHWGKVNYLSGEQLAAMHPKWSDWWRLRDQLDPQGTFLNSYLESIRP